VDPATGEITETMSETHQQLLLNATNKVVSEVLNRKTTVTLTHEADISISPENSALYTFMTTQDENMIMQLNFTSTVRSYLSEGTKLVSQGAVEEAIHEFKKARDIGKESDTLIAKQLIAWASFALGEDEPALRLAREVIQTKSSAWPARLVMAAASHSSPSLFREERLAGRVYLRSRLDPHDETAASISVGARAGDSVNWIDVSGDSRCLLVPRLTTNMRIKFQLSSKISELPTVQMYYLAAGIVDTTEMVPRSIEHEIAGGPVTATAHETLQFNA